MSFRRRLILFFVLIVALPMIAVAVLLSEVTAESDTGKVDAALDADLDVATALYNELGEEAARAAKRIASNPEFEAAISSGDEASLVDAATALADQRGIAALRLQGPSGEPIVTVGEGDRLAVASLDLVRRNGDPAGTLSVSTTTPTDYLTEVRERTGEDAVLVGPTGLEGAVNVAGTEIPAAGERGDVQVAGEERRVAVEDLPDSGGRLVALIGPEVSGGFFSSRPAVVAALVVFFLIALVAVGVLTRTLQGQVAAMLAAARRIGKGDFSQKVPVEGRDELAGLASEFNKMSDRLEAQMDELRSQQREIERSVERIGEAFASGLDRVALLRILAETAVSACDAAYGLIALTGQVGAEAEAGTASDAVSDVALAAEQRAIREGGVTEVSDGGAFALASSLGHGEADDEPLGAMTIAREGRRFSANERRVFLYLVGQAAASVENVALHELVAEQAVTDELTGLPNHRAFREAIRKEVARAKRFRHDLSLLILDIDDFKSVNDTYGHLQGDAVLRAIGRIVDDESRGIDEPARYGGEEFVIALPETSLEGALEVAERVRARIAAESVPRVDGAGALSVTASLGAASMDDSISDVNRLIAAADAALYEAKRRGKDRVVVADQDAVGELDGGHPKDGRRAQGPAPARRR